MKFVDGDVLLHSDDIYYDVASVLRVEEYNEIYH